MNRKKLGAGRKKGSGQAFRWHSGNALRHEPKDKRRLYWFYVVVDLLLVLAVATGALLAYVVWAPSGSKEDWVGETRTVQYTLEIADVQTELLGRVREGMTVTAFGTEDVLGTVDELKTEERSDEAGKSSVLVLTLTVETRYVQGQGYYVGDFRVAAGNDVEVLFENIYGAARCVAVAVKE
ncbi:MAG: hypothetical protein J6L87_04225 [Clostridia bacterium]|nr:hypothetical protein [Clostridia bacterium]